MMRAGLEPPLGLDGEDRGLELGGIEVVGVGVDVDEDRRGAQPGDDLAGGGEGEAGAEDRVAGPISQAISGRATASVPLAQLTAWAAPAKAASCRSSSPTSGPITY